MKIVSRILLSTAIIIFCSMCSVGTNSENKSENSNSNSNSKTISINSRYESISIAQGEQYQLHLYDNQKNDITESASWISDNPNIVSVNKGLVIIESNQGYANIYAKYDNEKSNSIRFNSGRVIFITESFYNGNLVGKVQEKEPMIVDGVIAADYLCNQDHNKPNFGNFKALISNLNIKNNFNQVIDASKPVNYTNKDGSLIGTSQLENGLNIISFTGIFYDKDQSSNVWNWSGFDNNCNNWSSELESIAGGVGFGNGANNWYDNQNSEPKLNGMWSLYSTVTCEHYQSLICVQQ